MTKPLTTTAPEHCDRYDLRASQIVTPSNIVKFYWKVVHEYCGKLGTVLDMGAGDGRFAHYGHYRYYTGIEIDSSKITRRHPRKHAIVTQGCAFADRSCSFDACIGNPPYLRHQDIEAPWKEKILKELSSELGASLSGHANLFLYFIVLGLLRTKPGGLCALIVPFDWVSRPSGRSLREFIRANRWNVSVYRFAFPVFDAVETTASISIIDKSQKERLWRYFDVSPELELTTRRGMTGTGRRLLEYKRRGTVFARRGISPGTQDVFTLTDGERIHHGLSRADVVPCVTSLREIPTSVSVLDRSTFEKEFVLGGRRCWLIRSTERLSPALRAYLQAVPASARATATCKRQKPWYKYEHIDVPQLLVHSAFTTDGPRIVVNDVRAIPVGAMYGIFGCRCKHEMRLRRQLLSRPLLKRIVPHSGRLRKLEVGQLNSVLMELQDG